MSFFNSKSKKVTFLTCACLAFTGVSYTHSAQAEENLDDLMSLSLNRLSEMNVYSVSKREEKASEAASAVYVLTNEDIKRSGATSIPEVLRLVPGLNVARAGATKWAISARGFNGGLANKLLVLIDGRSVYTPQYSGVFWDSQDVILSDIERIEVIRGPGSTMWGANAVNGVINITTKKAIDTQGTQVITGYGNEEQGFGSVRQGGKLGDETYYKIYTKFFNRNEQKTADGEELDNDWRFLRGGFRVDWEGTNDSLTMQGDAYHGEENLTLRLNDYRASAAPTYKNNIDETGNIAGGNIMVRWHHIHNEDRDSTFQAYWDNNKRHFTNTDVDITTYDFDFQQGWDINDRNEFVWGAGYRYITDKIAGTETFYYVPEKASEDVWSGFMQNKYDILKDELSVTLGTKVEDNDHTGTEIQPSFRFAWTPSAEHTVWGSVSKSARTPSRSEDDGVMAVGVQPNTGFYHWAGDKGVKSEDLVAYELGYRIQPTKSISFDLTGFYNQYDNLKTVELDMANPVDANSFATYYANNKGDAKSYGVEIATDWSVTKDWKLISGYSFLIMDIDLDLDSTDTSLIKAEGKSPKHQANLRSNWNITKSLEFDNTLYYTDQLKAINIDSYFRFDSRIAWKPSKDLEISLVGQNLFDDWHQEYEKSLNDVNSEVRRSVYGKIAWSF
ncbi:MAG: TonB-dependent receptor plug domain-containing protein [Alphaproteobacteria bacterium]